MHLGVLPVEVRLLHCEDVQIPLAVGHALPGRPPEQRLPVVRWQFAVFAAPFAEDVAVAFRRAGFRGQCRLEPFVHVRGVVRHDVDDDLHAMRVERRHEFVEILKRAQTWVHVAVVDHIIAAICKLGRVERGEPDGIHAKVLEIRHLFGDAGDVSESVAVGVAEATRVHLIDNGLFPPVVVHVVRGHGSSFLVFGNKFRNHCNTVCPVAPPCRLET